jgi:tetratricopeptide (TPR) repeat protein
MKTLKCIAGRRKVGRHPELGLLIILGLSQSAFPAQPVKTSVLVIGTIHGNHETSSTYTYQDLVNILAAYAPDAICVEIRPEDFRRKTYLREMMLATIYGLEQGLKVYPIDWWGARDDRAARDAFMKTPEYKEKLKKEEALVAANKVMVEFDKKYGGLDKLWDENKLGHEFFNGEEYNRYIEEMYSVSMAVYDDGPMNLSYRPRNDKMMELIRKALDENPGRRVVVLTGAEHKHYFDRALKPMPGVTLVKLADLLPLKPASLSENVSGFLKTNLARGYFDDSTPDGLDQIYAGALVSLLHGLGMDGYPERIPPANLDQARPILAEWQSRNPGSAYLQFDLAWVEFLASDYRKAIDRLEAIRGRLDQVPEDSRGFVKTTFDRNIGLCHDLLGERDKAIDCYKKGETVCRELGYTDGYIKYIFRDFKDKPYQREIKKDAPAGR